MSFEFASAADVMARALELARRGEGFVEPNPLVGAVVVDERRQLLGEGWHERFGGPHAEIQALAQAGARARGATLFVTLEPCSHVGKTPPCVDAVLHAGISRVVVAMVDPFPLVAGQGVARLRDAGVAVEVGMHLDRAQALTAPYRKLLATTMPWVHAKWAMTLDGKIASRSGHSQWISNDDSRSVVHRLRGRMDAIVIGIGTAEADDPLLTARPPGPRTATRVVVDRFARLALMPQLQLWQTAKTVPALVAAGPDAPRDRVACLQQAGFEVVEIPCREGAGSVAETGSAKGPSLPASLDLAALLREFGRRRFTNVLVEGGSATLGAFFDARLIDEVHAFVAPKLIGGRDAKTAIAGTGDELIPRGASLTSTSVEVLGGDVYIHGRMR
ncbi:MAG: bifunctional diaminohydroxyphosphoribosylaminopyrimidine deaminase/5-amino-6-(5-phosphoribosylamino)uracil reductase RibD [Planctomycetaceae bacterium]